MTREELQMMLSEIGGSEPERQGEIAATVLGEFDTVNSRMTEGVPDGASDWREAYNNLRRDYVNRFMGVSNVPGDIQPPNGNKSDMVDDGGPVSIADLFKNK